MRFFFLRGPKTPFTSKLTFCTAALLCRGLAGASPSASSTSLVVLACRVQMSGSLPAIPQALSYLVCGCLLHTLIIMPVSLQFRFPPVVFIRGRLYYRRITAVVPRNLLSNSPCSDSAACFSSVLTPESKTPEMCCSCWGFHETIDHSLPHALSSLLTYLIPWPIIEITPSRGSPVILPPLFALLVWDPNPGWNSTLHSIHPFTHNWM